jgi:hypothetical protein
MYVPDAVAWHRGSATLGRWHPSTVRNIAQNQLLLAARHFPSRWWWHVVVAQLLWGLVALRHGAGVAWCRGVAAGLGGFGPARRGFQHRGPEVPQYVLRSESELRDLQAATGFDTYWRLYFLLTAGGAK